MASRSARAAVLLLPLLLPAARARAEATVSAVLPAPAATPDSPAFPEPPAEPEPAAEPELELLERLKAAQESYERAMAGFRAGQAEEARTELRGAFALLSGTIDEERLTEALKTDFLSMLEKIRAWERPEPILEEPNELAVSEEALRSEAPAAPKGSRRAKSLTIKVDPNNELTKRFIHLYATKRPESVENALARSGRFREMIYRELRKAGLPRELFYLVMTESEYKLNAVSRSGAAGLWQFMPFTGRKYGLEVSYWVDERFHPDKATAAAIRYLKDLHDWFGDWHLAMAAYNRGEGGLGRDMEFTRASDFEVLSDRKGLPSETHQYVPKFMACVLIGEDPGAYGLKPKYETPLEYETVKLDRDLDLGLAAKAAGTDKETIQQLNPHVRAWCTPKNRPGFEFRVPKGTTQRFWEHLATVNNWNPGPEFVRYRVQRGDILSKIARRYNTTVHNIIQLNGIHNPRALRPGTTLRVRPGKGFRP